MLPQLLNALQPKRGVQVPTRRPLICNSYSTIVCVVMGGGGRFHAHPGKRVRGAYLLLTPYTRGASPGL
jgi:hypothetical protein